MAELGSYGLPPRLDDHGLSSIPGANYISQVWTDGSRESDDIISPKTIQSAYWEYILEHSTRGSHSTVPSNVSSSSSQPASMGIILEEENMTVGGLLASGSAVREKFQNSVPIQSNWQIPFGDNSVNLPIWPTDQSSHLELAYDPGTTLVDPKAHDTIMRNGTELLSIHPVQQNEQPVENKHQMELTKTELGDVDDFHMQTSSGISWSTVECGNVVDDFSLSPSISQDQFFSIIDFSPKWAYTDSENEVLIIGKFLKSLPEVAKCNWSCMFGEVEVPAEVLANGVLCCHAPPHSVGRVPFYVTCSNRLACSEVREFDYRVGSIKDIDIAIIYGGAATKMLLHMQLERLLSLISVSPPSHFVEGVLEKLDLISKVISLKEEEEIYQMAEPISQSDLSQNEVKRRCLKILMKEKLYSWLLHEVSIDGKGPSVLDAEGQGVLHLAAALGYDWAIKPIVTSGVDINFRDINGWTALHWAASCGRRKTVGFLVSLGAAPGALTDPSPEFRLHRTPADLAAVNQHLGISAFLAEHHLTSHLKSLKVNNPNEVRTEFSGQKVSEQTVTPANYGGIPETLSLRDSLTAFCNATLAYIHRMFRMHSLERRWITAYDDDDMVRFSDEHALSVVAAKTHKAKQSDGVVQDAATQIQKKFRGWKKRKEFLIIRQRIVKIQAHVRGHRARKKYRAIISSVMLLVKIEKHRRYMRIGQLGFRPRVRTKYPKLQDVPSKEDDYDFLKYGRKQTAEERLWLTRVKSTAQAKCRRLQTAVEGFQETKTSVVAKMEKRKSKDADHYDVRTGWKDPTELKAFCDLCAAQVLNGKRNGGYLKKEGVDAVIKQLGEIGKIVTHKQFKNKWDHLRKQWKIWKEVFEHETELGYDPVTGKIEASDEWWTRKLEAYPKASTFKNKPMPNVESMKTMFEVPVVTGKNAFCTSGEIPKEPRKKDSFVQEKSDSLKNFSDVIVESRSVSTCTPFASAAAAEVQAVMDMVLTLPGVQSGDRLHMFSTYFFCENQDARNMFATQRAQKEIQLRWLEGQYQRNPQFHS